jgi:hypothetical protein
VGHAPLWLSVILEIVLPLLGWQARVSQQNFTNSVRVFDRNWLPFPELAGVIVELGETQDISGHLHQVGFTVDRVPVSGVRAGR